MHETPPDAATIASEGAKPSEMATAAAATQPEAEAPLAEPPTPAAERERRSPLPYLLGLGAAAIVIVAIVLAYSGGGSDDSGSAAESQKTGQKNASKPKGPPSEKLGKPVKVGKTPVGVSVGDPSVSLDRLLVANQDSQTLSVFNAEGKPTQTLDVGASPRATDAGDENIWVVNSGDGTVSQFRQASLAFRQALTVGTSPQDVAVGNHAIWVANADGTISRITPSTSGVQPINVGGEPHGMAADPLSQNVYFTDRDAGSVRLIDPDSNTVTGEVSVGREPSGVAIDSTGAAWVAVTGAGELVSADPRESKKPLDSVKVGREPRDVAIGFDSVWVTCADGVYRVDPGTGEIVSVTDVGGNPQGIAVSDRANAVWVALSDRNELARIDVQQ
jgi:YVTN family beta-propeller protein